MRRFKLQVASYCHLVDVTTHRLVSHYIGQCYTQKNPIPLSAQHMHNTLKAHPALYMQRFMLQVASYCHLVGTTPHSVVKPQ